MIGFLFFLALQPILRKTECRVNLRYVQVVYWIQQTLFLYPYKKMWLGRRSRDYTLKIL